MLLLIFDVVNPGTGLGQFILLDRYLQPGYRLGNRVFRGIYHVFADRSLIEFIGLATFFILVAGSRQVRLRLYDLRFVNRQGFLSRLRLEFLQSDQGCLRLQAQLLGSCLLH